MIISSQHFIDYGIVDRKISALDASGVRCVSIPVVEIGEIDGVEYSVQIDGHHTLAAARELGLNVSFDSVCSDESLTGVDYLDNHYNDGDWYDVETSSPYDDVFDLVW